jgi:hypothetical protein
VPARADAAEDSASSGDEQHDDNDSEGTASDIEDGELREDRAARLAALQGMAAPQQPLSVPAQGGGGSAAAGSAGTLLVLC